MYTEIIELYNWCIGHSIPCSIESLFGGFKISFCDGSDFIQHKYSYGSEKGCVEPAGFAISFEPVTLCKAKKLIRMKKSLWKVRGEAV